MMPRSPRAVDSQVRVHLEREALTLCLSSCNKAARGAQSGENCVGRLVHHRQSEGSREEIRQG